MKKIYIKPDVEFVSFKMSSNIVASCEKPITHVDGQQSCLVDPNENDWGFFTSSSCETASDCYHVAAAYPDSVFGS